jgi:hypothetical protein
MARDDGTPNAAAVDWIAWRTARPQTNSPQIVEQHLRSLALNHNRRLVVVRISYRVNSDVMRNNPGAT